MYLDQDGTSLNRLNLRLKCVVSLQASQQLRQTLDDPAGDAPSRSPSKRSDSLAANLQIQNIAEGKAFYYSWIG